VEDNGAGISEEGQKNLFKDYSSLTEHRHNNSRGTGLGLCIVKKIITNIGGTISINSQLGKGTTFHIELSAIGIPPSEPIDTFIPNFNDDSLRSQERQNGNFLQSPFTLGSSSSSDSEDQAYIE